MHWLLNKVNNVSLHNMPIFTHFTLQLSQLNFDLFHFVIASTEFWPISLCNCLNWILTYFTLQLPQLNFNPFPFAIASTEFDPFHFAIASTEFWPISLCNFLNWILTHFTTQWNALISCSENASTCALFCSKYVLIP